MRGQQRQEPQLSGRERRRADGDRPGLAELGLQLAGQFRENAEVRPLLKDVVDLVRIAAAPAGSASVM
jgi:hypothetical protein